MRKGVVSDQGTEAVGQNDVGLFGRHGIQNASASLLLKILILDPGNDITRRPLHPVRQVPQHCAAPPKYGTHPAACELPYGLHRFPHRQIHPFEDIVVGKKGKLQLNVLLPRKNH